MKPRHPLGCRGSRGFRVFGRFSFVCVGCHWSYSASVPSAPVEALVEYDQWHPKRSPRFNREPLGLRFGQRAQRRGRYGNRLGDRDRLGDHDWLGDRDRLGHGDGNHGRRMGFRAKFGVSEAEVKATCGSASEGERGEGVGVASGIVATAGGALIGCAAMAVAGTAAAAFGSSLASAVRAAFRWG